MIKIYNTLISLFRHFIQFNVLILLCNIGLLWAEPEGGDILFQKKVESDSFQTIATKKQIFINEKGLLSSRGLAESVVHQFRKLPGISIADIGFPGAKSFMYSLDTYQPVTYSSFFNPVGIYSPYGSGGLMEPAFFRTGNITGPVSKIEEIWIAPTQIDTPQLRLNWKKGAFEMNLFRLSVSRMLTERAYFSIDFASNKSDSLDYSYSFQTHQPYLSGFAGLDKLIDGLDRDSASMVIEGVSQMINSLHFRPRVGYWIDSSSVFEAYLDRFRNSSDLVSPLDNAKNSNSFEEIRQVPIRSEFYALTLGAVYRMQRDHLLTQLGYYSSGTKIKEQTLNPLGFYEGNQNTAANYETFEARYHKVDAMVSLPSLFGNPRLHIAGVNEEINHPIYLIPLPIDSTLFSANATHAGWGDHQELKIKVNPDFAFLKTNGRVGVTRYSYMHNKKRFAYLYGLQTTFILPWQLTVGFGSSQKHRFPTWEKMYVLNSLRSRYPNPELSHETLRNLNGNIGIKFGSLKLETAINFNTIDQINLPAILPFTDSIVTDDSLALKLVNYPKESRNTWIIRGRYQLGNWYLGLEHSYLIKNILYGNQLDSLDGRNNPLLPKSILKGNFGWNRHLLDNKLWVSVNWDWERYSNRYAWAPQLNGTSRSIKLEEYTALDFTAQMKIRSFILFYQIKNFNHDRYYLEPGSHPPGVNFRWGVDWVLNG